MCKVNSPDLVKGMGVILDEENLEKRYTSMREGEKNGEPFPLPTILLIFLDGLVI